MNFLSWKMTEIYSCIIKPAPFGSSSQGCNLYWSPKDVQKKQNRYIIEINVKIEEIHNNLLKNEGMY